jgi:hypothetical protein
VEVNSIMLRNFTLVVTAPALHRVQAEIAGCSIEDPVAVLIEYSEVPLQASAIFGACADEAAMKEAALAWLKSGAAPPRRLKPALYPRKWWHPFVMKSIRIDGITFLVPRHIAATTSRALLDIDNSGFRLTGEAGVLLMPVHQRAERR